MKTFRDYDKQPDFFGNFGPNSDDMNGLIAAHSGLRWIVLLILLVAIFRAIIRRNTKEYDKSDQRVNLFALIFTHIQVTIGIILLFVTSKVSFEPGWMKVDYLRFYVMEHIPLMLIAAILLTIGRKKAEKKAVSTKKHTTIIVFYTITLLLILAAIPWPFRIAGAGWM